MQFQYCDSVYRQIGIFVQIVARDVVNKPVQHYNVRFVYSNQVERLLGIDSV